MPKLLKYAVEVPDEDSGQFNTLEYFDTKKKAIEWARKHLGADSKGNICVVSKLPED